VNKLTEFLIMSGWILLLCTCFTTIGAVVHLSVFFPNHPINDNLSKLAFAAAGFLFGSLPSLIKDLLWSKSITPTQ